MIPEEWNCLEGLKMRHLRQLSSTVFIYFHGRPSLWSRRCLACQCGTSVLWMVECCQLPGPVMVTTRLLFTGQMLTSHPVNHLSISNWTYERRTFRWAWGKHHWQITRLFTRFFLWNQLPLPQNTTKKVKVFSVPPNFVVWDANSHILQTGHIATSGGMLATKRQQSWSPRNHKDGSGRTRKLFS